MEYFKSIIEAIEIESLTICKINEFNDLYFYDMEDNLAFKIVYVSTGNYCVLVPKNYANFDVRELKFISKLMMIIETNMKLSESMEVENASL